MIRKDELHALLAHGEADRIERTASTRDTDKFAGAVTAFANDLAKHRPPGSLAGGVRDDGTPSGLPVSDELLRNRGGLTSDRNIQPLPTMTVAKFSLPGGEVAVAKRTGLQPHDP